MFDIFPNWKYTSVNNKVCACVFKNISHTLCKIVGFRGFSWRSGWTHRLFSAKIKMDNENIYPHNGWLNYSQFKCIKNTTSWKGYILIYLFFKSWLCWCFDELQYFTAPEIHNHPALKICIFDKLCIKTYQTVFGNMH